MLTKNHFCLCARVCVGVCLSIRSDLDVPFHVCVFVCLCPAVSLRTQINVENKDSFGGKPVSKVIEDPIFHLCVAGRCIFAACLTHCQNRQAQRNRFSACILSHSGQLRYADQSSSDIFSCTSRNFSLSRFRSSPVHSNGKFFMRVDCANSRSLLATFQCVLCASDEHIEPGKFMRESVIPNSYPFDLGTQHFLHTHSLHATQYTTRFLLTHRALLLCVCYRKRRSLIGCSATSFCTWLSSTSSDDVTCFNFIGWCPIVTTN